MAQIGSMADSAQYLPLKRYAEEIKQANSQASTTTTAKTHKPKGGGGNVDILFGKLGGYVGLQRICIHLPAS
jgi:hypothetical protein